MLSTYSRSCCKCCHVCTELDSGGPVYVNAVYANAVYVNAVYVNAVYVNESYYELTRFL